MDRRTFLTTAATLPLVAHLPHNPVTHADLTPYPIYLVGDSITKGRAATWEGLCWRELVRVALQDANPDKNVYLETESTFGSGWKVADAQAAVTATPPTPDTALIIVAIGTNDFDGNQGSSSRTTITAFRASYPALINGLHAAAPSARLLCVSVWEGTTSGSNVRSDFDTAIQNAALAVGGAYVSIVDHYGNSNYHGPSGRPEDWYMPGWQTDVFHPNEPGHAAIATRILGAI